MNQFKVVKGLRKNKLAFSIARSSIYYTVSSEVIPFVLAQEIKRPKKKRLTHIKPLYNSIFIHLFIMIFMIL